MRTSLAAERMSKASGGAIAFVEFYSKDTAAAKKFLENVFGWKMTKTSAGGVDIWMFDLGNGLEGHMMARLGLPEGSTVAFIKVKSVDRAVQRTTRFCGKVLVPKFEVPALGYFSYLEAPGGTIHAAYQPKRKK
jgi:predicted enzyme related to lactoylglutathione lyase